MSTTPLLALEGVSKVYQRGQEIDRAALRANW